MKDIYVNKEGVICACTQAVPNYPEKPGPMSHQQFFTEYYEDDLPTYDIMLKACKESAVPFEEREIGTYLNMIARKNTGNPNAVFTWKPDTFYQIDCDWEIVEIPWAEIDHQPGSTALTASTKMVARLKVQAPTVATDNSGDIYTIYKNGKLLEPDPNFNPLSIRCASPVEEEQEKLWREVEMLIETYTEPVLELKTRFLLIRK